MILLWEGENIDIWEDGCRYCQVLTSDGLCEGGCVIKLIEKISLTFGFACLWLYLISSFLGYAVCWTHSF